MKNPWNVLNTVYKIQRDILCDGIFSLFVVCILAIVIKQNNINVFQIIVWMAKKYVFWHCDGLLWRVVLVVLLCLCVCVSCVGVSVCCVLVCVCVSVYQLCCVFVCCVSVCLCVCVWCVGVCVVFVCCVLVCVSVCCVLVCVSVCCVLVFLVDIDWWFYMMILS